MSNQLYVASNINYLCDINKTSGKELASYLGKKEATVSAYRKGRSLPPIDIIVQIAEYFRVDLTELVMTDLRRSELPEKKDYAAAIQELAEKVAVLEERFEKENK